MRCAIDVLTRCPQRVANGAQRDARANQQADSFGEEGGIVIEKSAQARYVPASDALGLSATHSGKVDVGFVRGRPDEVLRICLSELLIVLSGVIDVSSVCGVMSKIFL